MNSKQRDWKYGIKPRNIEQKAEEIPQPRAKKPFSGYCKKLKDVHVFSLKDVKVYQWHGYPQGYAHGAFITGWTDWKEYRCEGCSKKKMVMEEFKLDVPVRAEEFARV